MSNMSKNYFKNPLVLGILGSFISLLIYSCAGSPPPPELDTPTPVIAGDTTEILSLKKPNNLNTSLGNKKLLEGSIDFIKGNTTYYVPDSMPLGQISKVTLSTVSPSGIPTLIFSCLIYFP